MHYKLIKFSLQVTEQQNRTVKKLAFLFCGSLILSLKLFTTQVKQKNKTYASGQFSAVTQVIMI